MSGGGGNSNVAENADPNSVVSGWVYDCGYRGTLDIVYGCVVVLVAAIWTVVHLNVPAGGESDSRIFWRRARWGLVSVTAPDFLTLVAAAQWDSAKKSVRQMKELTNSQSWSIVHAFYANGGGFVLETPDLEAFPINATSVHYLVSRGYIPLPAITREEIWDKSKADVFAKGLALLQSAWIFIQAIARTSQKLPLSPLELFTLAFVISTVMSYFFWWRKPQHVGTPTVLRCETTMSRIRADAGYPDDVLWTDTPMDFVEKSTQHWKRRSVFQNYDLERGARKMEVTELELPQWNGNQGPESLRLDTASSSIFEEPRPLWFGQRGTDEKALISPLSSRASTLVVSPKTDGKETTDDNKPETAQNEKTGNIITEIQVDTTNNKKTGAAENEEDDAITRIEEETTTNPPHTTTHTVTTWTQTPARRIPDDSIMAVRLPTKMVVLLLVPSLIHSSIHLAGWNHEFPTQAEQTMWRIAVVMLAAMSSISVGAVRVMGLLGYQGRYNLLWAWVNANADPRRSKVWDVVLGTSTFLLILARLFLIIEVCVSLRQLPAKAYVEVDWTNYIPHI
ncbi:hypothetical protein B0H66DRAFT_531268 [Apodospora peruviana]|uniref:Uncharacterized protein n=1 Tax=Apodospora peruviana TaxID=516989 RepID=A0AAE0M7L7_9PEZI|nr:hypothetical protein B0H66DRAFT_531268 [Apodospora peruviana]